MNIMLAKLATFMLGAVALVAQGQSFFVDLNNGPGTNYTDLQTAIQAVPDGSSLWVRQGNYPAVTIAGKGLTILGVTSVSLGGLRISNLAASQTVAVSGIRFRTDATLDIANAAGSVVIDGEDSLLNGQGLGILPLRIQASPQVHLRRFRIEHGLGDCAASISGGSSVVLESSDLFGSHLVTPELSMVAAPAVRVWDSMLQLVETPAAGGNGGVSQMTFGVVVSPGAPGVVASNAVLRILGNGQWVRGGRDPAQLGGMRQPAITGTGSVVADQAIGIDAGPSSTVAFARSAMPRVVATNAPLGAALSVRRSGPSNVLAALVASLHGRPWQLPGIPYPVWIDAGTMVVDSLGVVPSSGSLQIARQVPNVMALRGLAVTWQVVDLDGVGQVSISNPSLTLVGY
ncbi:MAG: hypothetical protein JNK49_01670 [Planctomycetes bacterium]|nr:hypothetical protein [Planctomycetota bacterium]